MTRGGTRTVKAYPYVSRQLDGDGPLLFWRTAQDGRRKGMVVIARNCVAPECGCREAQCTAYAVDDALITVRQGPSGRLTLTAQPDPMGRRVSKERTASVAIDIDSGEVHPKGDAEDEALVDWLGGAMDGEVLDLLHRRWLLAKGRDPDAAKPRLEGLDLDDSLRASFGEVFPDERSDDFVLDGRRFLAVDLYCVDPACVGDEGVVLFVEEQPDSPTGEDRDVGSIRVDLASGVAVSLEASDAADAALLGRLWGAFCARHRVAVTLWERMRRVRAACAPLAREAAAASSVPDPKAALPAPRPGRNDPCPCGSGRKYKKCCEPRAAHPGGS